MGRVIIIDDDDAMRGTIRKILEREGHEVREARNGRAGVELFRAEGADVVLTDLIMPEQEGIETIIALRNESEEVRILAMSGGGEDGVRGQRLGDATELGANAAMEKPFTVNQLREAVAALMK